MARQSRAPIILLTRPLAQSQRFAAELAKSLGQGLHIVISPLMATEYLQPDLPAKSYTGIVLTSETAAVAAKPLCQRLPTRAYCVGDRTAVAARAAGFEAISAKGDAAALIAYLTTRQIAGPLLYLRGTDTRGNVAEMLTKGGIETDSRVIYDQRPLPLSVEATQFLRDTRPIILPLFSPRSAVLFRHAYPRPNAPLLIAAMSAAVADAAQALTPTRLEIADRPDAAAMIAVITALLAADDGS